MNKDYDFTPLTIHPDATSALEPMRPLFKWPSVRWQKVLALYTLARQCKCGPIIELGTYHGCGTLALAIGNRDGSRVPLYTIDPFIDCDGWIAGEHYAPSDYDIYEANVAALGLTGDIGTIAKKSEDAVRKFSIPYELLFWDIGGSRLVDDYQDWHPLCRPNGRIIVKDLPSWRFGTNYVLEHATQNGFTPDVSHRPGCMWVIRRTS